MGILVAAFIKANKRAHVEAVVVNMREVGFESPLFEWQGVVAFISVQFCIAEGE